MDAFLDDDGLEARRTDAPPGLFLSRRGAWYHDGDRVKHAGLEGLLHRSIARDDAGKLLVTTGRDVMPFVAEDAPLFIRTLTPEGGLQLSDGSVDDGAGDFTIDDHGHIRVSVKGAAFWALASRSAAQLLLARVDADGFLPLPAGIRSLTPAHQLWGPDVLVDWSRAPTLVMT